MKLRIEHIAPYLPYNLQLRLDGRTGLLSGLNFKRERCLLTFANNISDLAAYESVQPLLKSMDSFIGSEDWKEIESEFNPLGEKGTLMYGFSKEGIRFSFTRKIGDISENAGVTFQFYQELFTRHYDVFGLIEKGLAIDIKTLEND